MTQLHFSPDIDWGYTLALAAFVALLVLIAGIACGVWIGRRIGRPRRVTVPPPPPPPPTRPPPAAPPPGPDVDRRHADGIAAQRGALVAGCVKVRGLLDDQMLANSLDDALRAAGVAVIDPVGSRSDPAAHRIAGTDPAPSPAHDGVISRTLRPAFVDGGRVVRTADVVVYKWGS